MFFAIPIFLFAISAFVLSGLVGGGASLILIPVLAFVVPIREMPGALVIGTFTSSLSRSLALHSKIRWDLVRFFLPSALPAVVIGAWLLRYTDPLMVSWFSALFLISNLPAALRKQEILPPPQKKFDGMHICVIGFLAGLLSGVTGAVGLIFNGFYLSSGLSKEEVVATRAANEILLHLLKLCMYYYLGLFSTYSIFVGLVIAAAALLSTLFLKKILPYMDENFFKRVGYAAMVVSGVILLSQTSRDILVQRKPSIEFVKVTDGIETKGSWSTKIALLEIEYDGNVSIERVVSIENLPPALISQVKLLTDNADRFLLEEVFSWRKHYYEVYVYKGDLEHKYEVSLKS